MGRPPKDTFEGEGYCRVNVLGRSFHTEKLFLLLLSFFRCSFLFCLSRKRQEGAPVYSSTTGSKYCVDGIVRTVFALVAHSVCNFKWRSGGQHGARKRPRRLCQSTADPSDAS